MTGRPSSFTQETADTICERMAEGESLRSICRDDAMPHRLTVLRWADTNEAFRDQYARARDHLADFYNDDILDIADHGNGEDVARAKLRIDTRKWAMSKMAPRKYGDRVTTEIGGIDGKPIEVADVTDLDRAKALAAMIAKTRAVAQE
jgi:hypothetical protein